MRELRTARAEIARLAVTDERLRFARDRVEAAHLAREKGWL